MADWIFFRDSWIHEYVDFEQPYPSRWKVIELISEHSHQPAVQADMQELENSPPSYSEATFLCRNARDPAQEAFLRVYMQIPHLGTEDASHSIRSAQAGFRTHDDIEAMKLFRDNRARYVPWCLGVKDIKQDNFGLVPGGYMSYLLWEKLPGVHLDMETFWSLDRAERDAIREAFEPAYKELQRLRIRPLYWGLEHLLWDREKGTVYIIGFRITIELLDDEFWNEKILAAWDLAVPPKCERWWNEDYGHKGTKDWKF